MKNKILIAGIGQLGSRYLQGLFNTNFETEIWAYDISVESLNRANMLFNEIGVSQNKVHYITTLDLVPKEIDIAIITSTADVRVKIVQEILIRIEVKYWILEKILAQSHIDLFKLNKLLIKAKGIWVNTPMYLWPLYLEIKKLYSSSSLPLIAKFIGFKGLACNSIHYIDFVARWNNSNIINYDISQLEDNWVKSKRPNFYEINGQIIFRFSDGSDLILVGSENSADFSIELQIGEDTWLVNESKGVAKCSCGKIINAPILFQSQLTSELINNIIKNEKCELPTLAQSTVQHTMLLNALLEHWNQNKSNKASTLPIT